MPKRGAVPKAALAAEAWRRLFHLLISTRAQRDEVLGRHRLTPNDIRALTSLSPRQGRTMRSLAEEWGCDASNATWIVDRIERRGLATRRTPAADRRVKQGVLPAPGDGPGGRVLRDRARPPREFLAMDMARLEAIRDALPEVPRRPA